MVGLELIDFLTQRLKAKEASLEYRNRRATYLKCRHAELDRIRVLDAAYRSQLRAEPSEPWDRDESSPEAREMRDEANFELHISYRFLVHAVEGYLLDCREISCVTGESVLARVTSGDELVVTLQAEEDSMIALFGAPWEEEPSVVSDQLGLFSRDDRVEERLDPLFTCQMISIEA